MKLLHITAAAIASTIALAPILIAPAQAADPLGTWLAGDKKGKIRIVNCGGGDVRQPDLAGGAERSRNQPAKARR